MSKVLFKKKLPFGSFITFDQKPDFRAHTLIQTHSSIIKDTFLRNQEADGFVFKNNSKDKFMIKTADCLPIYLCDQNSSFLLHAGWRGLHNGIIHKTKNFSKDIHYAFIGPCISKDFFEVKNDFYQFFPNKKNYTLRDNKLYFDLIEETKDQLKSLSPNITIEEAHLCTHRNIDFHSYRRDKTSERNWNMWTL